MPTAAWDTFVELAPWLLVGAAIAGVLEVLLPPGLLRRQLGGRWGVAKAVAFGVPLPLCSCGVIPTGLGLKKQGASDGATVGFLISTPQTGVDSVLVTAAMLGWPFALFKLATAAATGLVGGEIANRLAGREPNRDDPPMQPAPLKPTMTLLPVIDTPPADAAPAGAPTGQRWRDGLATADELLRSIWLWVVVGVAISAAIEAWAPTGSIDRLADYRGLPGMLAALVISLPLYVCATASVPIAASLVAAGLPAGAAMVFLMAGPATNVASLGAVYRVLGGRQLAVYLTTITAGSVAGGLLFGWLIEPADAAPTHAHDHGHAWWALASAALLLLLFARYGAERLFRRTAA